MSFYTSLTGLNASQADLAAISNNIANVGTTGFKLSTAQFGDIFANSPLQNANAAVGSGTILKKVQQEFTQGNIESSQNSLDMAISGQGFFALKPSLTSTQTVYTRNGTFTVNNNNYIVDSQGEYLQGFPVNSDGSVIATDASSAINLQIPSTSGLPKATSNIELGLNLPANATIIPDSSTYTASNPYVFDHTNPATYNQSTSITIYDSLGNPTIATIYYVKTANATSSNPTNTWQTHVFVGDKEVDPSLITAKSSQGSTIYINKFGQTTTDPTSVDSSFVPNQPSPLYYQDQQNTTTPSTAAQVQGAIQNLTGFDFGNTDSNTVQIVTDPALYSTTREGGNTAANAPYWGNDMFTVSVDGSQPQSISINAGTYNGEQLAAEMTRAVNAKFSSANYFRITDTYRDPGGSVVAGNDVFDVNLSKTNTDGSTSTLNPPLEIDLLGTAGAAGTPASGGSAQQLNYQDLTQQQLIDLAQTKINDALNARHDEFGKNSDWVDPSNPPIKVGFDVSTNSLTFTADPSQLGADATLPQNRYNTIQVYNPTSSTNDLGLPSQTSSTAATISASTSWTGLAVSPNGPPILDAADQRTGILVDYNKNSDQFTFSSGQTGETSSIQVGRAQLSTINDVQPQINSYDLSNLSLHSGQSLTLESDGKSFTYTVPFLSGGQIQTVSGTQDTSASLGGSSATITTPGVSAVTGVTGVNEVQTLTLSSEPTAGLYSISIPTISGTIDTKTVTLTSGTSAALATAIQSAFSADGITCAAVSNGSGVTLNYSSAQPITGTMTLTPTAGTPVIATQTTPGVSAVTAVNGVNEVRTLNLSSEPTAGSYSISIPTTSGTIDTKTVTLTSGTSAALATAIQAAFSADGITCAAVSNGSGVTLTYSSAQPITGTMTLTPTVSTPVIATKTTTGNSSVNEVQTLTLSGEPTTGYYLVSVPKSDGTTDTQTINLVSNTSAALANAIQSTFGAADGVNCIAAANGSGVVLTYNAKGAITGNLTITPYVPQNLSVTSFVNNIQQAMPVTFTPTAIANSGTPTSQEVQTFTPYGNLLNGDKFNLSIQENIDSTSTTLANVSVGPLTGLTGLSQDKRIAALATAIESSLSNATAGGKQVDLSSAVKIAIDPNNPAQIDITYQTNGAVSTAASIEQTTRGVADGITPNSSNIINFVSQTVNPTPATELTSGNAKTQEAQSATIQPSTIGDQLKINPGDQYTVSVPQSDGTVNTKTVTVPSPGNMAGLLAALNGPTSGAGPFGSVVTFSNPTAANGAPTNDLVMTYNTPGSITGTFTISQTAVGVASTTTPITYTSTLVRPQSIGPFSISGTPTLTGGRLLVEGNPDGSSFHLNILSNGQVVQEEPQGAIGSKTQTGREIGQSMATTADPASFFSGSNDLLGVGVGKDQTSIAGTGLGSTPAVATGTTAITPMNQTFLLNAGLGENVMTVTVDGITGTIDLPVSSYTGDTFAAAIQERINQIQDPTTGQVVSGVTVKYDSVNNSLIFTSGTQGSTSQINVVGSANFGLSNVTQTPGSVPSITVLQQATDANGNKLYVDANGNITTQAPTTKLQDWSPLYLTPGELTFNTAGNLQSPIQGVVYSPFDPGNGSNPLNLTINYGKLSTQYNQSFSVNSLTQDGYPSGSLNGLSIDSSGTVTASYTNGQSTALGKVMIANFANQNGLKQVGNTNYVATAASGGATLGQAGSNGFGSIQAGALEQSNVDITQELVNLITAQRNFQANAKAIETDTSLTQTIVQIRE